MIGLAPLLYEGSNQAEFLKPTVITLVYGLGFGMVLVLLVVPAIMAMQSDIARQIAAARRGLRRGGGPVRAVVWTGAVAMIALFGALMVPVLWPDVPWDAPVPGGLWLAFAAYLAALAAVLLVAYVLAALATLILRRRAR